MNSYKSLSVYEKSMDFVVDLYEITRKFPEDEKFGLTSQIRRAAISIPSNIAEGSQRQSRKEYVKFLYVSYGSCGEIETQLLIVRRLEMLSEIEYQKISQRQIEISKMLRGLIKSLS